MKEYGEREKRWRSAQIREDAFWQRDRVIESQMDRVVSRYGPVVERLSENLDPDSRILDVGCGPTCTARLFTRGQKIYLDPLLDSYVKTYGDRFPQGDKIRAVAENMPLRDNSFDLVICVNALDHMIDPVVVLKEMGRVLREGGILVLGNFLHPPKIAAVRKFIEKWMPAFREDAHPYSYTLKSMKELLSRFFDIRQEIRVYRKDSALFPSIHREDWIFICNKGKHIGFRPVKEIAEYPSF